MATIQKHYLDHVTSDVEFPAKVPLYYLSYNIMRPLNFNPTWLQKTSTGQNTTLAMLLVT